MRGVVVAFLLGLLGLAPVSALVAAEPAPVKCEGDYAAHLQGVAVDQEAIYWSFTTELVKTDRAGKKLLSIPVANHHGDLCVHDGQVYVAVNLGKFNDPAGKADSWIYVYKASDLAFVSKSPVQDVIYGAGGIEFLDGKFWVVGGLPGDHQQNRVYEYDPQFKLIKEHRLESGQTLLGIQTCAFAGDRWWFGCYGNPAVLLIADKTFTTIERKQFNCSLGIALTPEGTMVAARGSSQNKRHFGEIYEVIPDKERGLTAAASAPTAK